MKPRITLIQIVSILFAVMLISGSALAAQPSIAVLDVQKVVAESDAGKAAQEEMSKKMKELQAKFKKEEDALMALQKEIEKKSSVWSAEVKEQKTREFQKKRRELQGKSEDARFELNKLKEDRLEPILKNLREVVETIGKTKKYTVILDDKAGVLYNDESVNITDSVIKALNKKMKH